MSEASEKIAAWAQEFKNYTAAEWSRMPEIYLYMDQVMTYMNKQLCLFERDETSSLLTSSMINNYVKDGVLPRPEQKKYSREHLALLTVICMLKPVLSIPDVSMLTKELLKDASPNEMYDRFCGAQSAALKEVCERVEEKSALSDSELTKLAIELSVEANARRTAVERILSQLSSQKERHEKEKKEK